VAPPPATGAQPPPPPPAAPVAGQPVAAPAVAGPPPEAVKRSVTREALCAIVSIGAYHFWWFYAYRRLISRELGTFDRAGWQTAGLAVPILNIFILYWIWRDINTLVRQTGDAGFAAGWFVAASVVPYVNYVGAPVCFCLVGAKLNEYWDKRAGGRAADAAWTTGEKLATFLPLPVLILGIAITAVVSPG